MTKILTVLLFITFCCTMLASWITHVVVCISAKAWLLLIAGGIVAPVGILHGIATWFGFSWT